MPKLLNLPPLASDFTGTDQLIRYLHLLMAVLFVGWLIYFFYALWRFQRRRQQRADPVGVRSHAGSYLEITVAGLEAALLLFVAVPWWSRAVDQFPRESEATRIQVMAQQFAWNYRLPGEDGEFGRQNLAWVSDTNLFGVDLADTRGHDDIQLLNEVHVPVNKPVIAYISSKDVIHSFKIPSMRVTQDAIPGMRIPIWFKPVKEGRYQIFCAQLCGNGHAAMAGGFLVVESEEDYQRWLAQQARVGSGAPVSYE